MSSTGATSTTGGQRPTAPPPPRPGGSIASAFTGSLPRLQPDDSDPSSIGSLPPYTPAGYPPPVENATNGTQDPNARWAPERDPEPHTQVQPLEPQVPDDPSGVSLFGDAFAAEKAAREAQEGRRPVPPPTPEVNRDLDAPTERLPIYEAVLSQWFEEGDGEKRQSAASERGRPAGADVPVQASAPPAPPVHTPAPPPPPAPVSHVANGTNGVNGTNGDSPYHHEPEAEPEPEVFEEHAEPVAEEPQQPQHAVRASASLSAWQSPGDEGWQAAQKLGKAAPEVVTSAGLPKRVPKAQLIPGSAPSRPGSGSATSQRSPALPPRSADAVRGRMSSFQQGIRRGRHAMVDAYAGDQDSVESRQDEEQE
jgi:hypothetical protein